MDGHEVANIYVPNIVFYSLLKTEIKENSEFYSATTRNTTNVCVCIIRLVGVDLLILSLSLFSFFCRLYDTLSAPYRIKSFVSLIIASSLSIINFCFFGE